jgi:hypothetical protein
MTIIAKTPRKYTKPRKTYKQAIEPHRIADLEAFLYALEGAWDKCKREGVKPNMSECIEALRHR